MMNTRKNISKKFRRGSILGAVIVIGLCLALLGFAMLQMGFGARVNSAISVAQINAREAADAGLTHALYRMNASLNFQGIPTAEFPVPLQLYTVAMDSSNTTAVYQLSEFPGIPYPYYVITSTGRINNENRRIQTVHAITRRSTYWFGVGVQEDFFVHDNATFGTYPPGSPFEGSVRTNSIANDAITIMSDNAIPGDVSYGPTGLQELVIKTPGEEPGDVIDGSIYANDNLLAFPDAELPPDDVIASLGGWQPGPVPLQEQYLDTGEIDPSTGFPIRRATITSPPEGIAYRYIGNFFTLPTFSGDVVWELRLVGTFIINVTENMIIPGNARLTIGDQDPAFIDNLELYLGSIDGSRSSLDARTGSSIVTMPRAVGELPHSLDLKIYGLPTCSSPGNNPDITIHNSGEFWGVIYAPRARLDIRNSGIMYGGFVGYSIELYGNGGFYYDSRIPMEYNEGPFFFEIERWWEDNQHLVIPAT